MMHNCSVFHKQWRDAPDNRRMSAFHKNNVPAVLVELAYVTNAGDAEKLETLQPEFARGIYEGLLSYFGLDQ